MHLLYSCSAFAPRAVVEENFHGEKALRVINEGPCKETKVIHFNESRSSNEPL